MRERFNFQERYSNDMDRSARDFSWTDTGTDMELEDFPLLLVGAILLLVLSLSSIASWF